MLAFRNVVERDQELIVEDDGFDQHVAGAPILASDRDLHGLDLSSGLDRTLEGCIPDGKDLASIGVVGISEQRPVGHRRDVIQGIAELANKLFVDEGQRAFRIQFVNRNRDRQTVNQTLQFRRRYEPIALGPIEIGQSVNHPIRATRSVGV